MQIIFYYWPLSGACTLPLS